MEETTTQKKILRGKYLTKIYGKRTVVNHISIEVSKGEAVGLLGPNGAGKTTTFHMFTGMVKPSSGNVFINDRNVTSLPMYKRAQLGIGYLSQEPSVFRKLTVEENLLLVLQTLGISRKDQLERLEVLLDELNIRKYRKSKAYTLSGGERRRTELTRALVTNPDFILLDEPFVGVDPIAVEDIQKIILGLKDRNIGVLITDHNVHETLSITDRSYLMFEGNILKAGSSEYLANDEDAKRLYLGDGFRLDR
ncbi:MAG: LPS export ABC transporter ATP-binding protein [Candidatus Marinimicrobia bacterium]|nr:LPS export ABC transporter ATP-binding protein [Candidatus Neomarinimicrobiota bacterium]